MKGKIYITATDRARILKCIEDIEEGGSSIETPHVQHLKQEVDKAKVLDNPKKTPANVITMRTRVNLVDKDSGKSAEYTLVYPNESDPMERRISVLAPLGTAMLGYRTGDTFSVTLPARVAHYTVESIAYQPEAAGDFDL